MPTIAVLNPPGSDTPAQSRRDRRRRIEQVRRGRREQLTWRALDAAVVIACSMFVLWQLHPLLILRDTTAAGGDMAAHVWFPAYLRDELLPNLRVAGWTFDWYAGFPAGQFYFPLPAILVVLLDLVLPYNVAFKVITVLGPVALPASVYVFARGLRFQRPAPALMAAASTVFLFFRGIADPGSSTHDGVIGFNQRIMGGTLASTLAGEFSFTIALCFAFCFLGALGDSLTRRRRLWLPALLLAATVLSHVVVAMFAVVGALAVLAFLFSWRSFRVAIAIGSVGALLTAFWTVPLLATFSYTASMRYERLSWYRDYLLGSHFWWAYPFALVALVIGVRRRDRAVLCLAAITGLFALLFVVWPELHAWNLRLLPFWYMGLLLLAAVGAADGIRWVAAVIARSWVYADADTQLPVSEEEEAANVRLGARVRTVTTVSLIALLVVGTLVQEYRGRGFLDFWAEWNYSGMEDTSARSTLPKAYPEYERLIRTMDRLPPGRAMWEGGQAVDRYGSPLALELLPYWTHGRIGSMEGLYFESAATTPYHFMTVAMVSGAGSASNPVRGLDYRSITDFAFGVREMRDLGVRYYLAQSDEAKAAAARNNDLELVTRVPDLDNEPPSGWNVYEIRDHALVAPLRAEPVVVNPQGGRQSECFGRTSTSTNDPKLGAWECLAAGWWDDPEQIDRPLAAGGPASWARVDADDVDTAPRRPLPSVEVRDIHSDQQSIAFRVSRTGVPVVVRGSYFPNWRVEGAEGPWRLTPNLMVVVPTQSNVELHYARSGPEWIGIALTALGLLGLGTLVWWGRRDRRRGTRAAPEGGEPGTDRAIAASTSGGAALP